MTGRGPRGTTEVQGNDGLRALGKTLRQVREFRKRLPMVVDLDFSAAAAENRAPCGPVWWSEWTSASTSFSGTTASTLRFPVRDGDVDQARLRAALTQRPNDDVVAVTADAYIRVGQRSSMTTTPMRRTQHVR